jgi:hypothetical protein
MMIKQELKSRIYSTNSAFERPETLIHYVGGYNTPDHDAVESIKATGLQANHGGWELDHLMPHRPAGIFLFGAEMDSPLSHKITVQVADLDTNKLYAYPSALADAMAMIAEGRIDEKSPEYAALIEIAAETEPVRYDEYSGEFAAEWIYTDDIDAEIIE